MEEKDSCSQSQKFGINELVMVVYKVSEIQSNGIEGSLNMPQGTTFQFYLLI